MRETISNGRRHRIIGALGIAQILGYGTSYYLPAILAQPIAADTGWPFAWVIGGLSLGLLVAGLASRQVGHTIERHGGRPVLAASALLLALGLAMLALAPNLPVYVAAWVLLGLGMAAGLYDAAFSTLARIFGAGARGAITTLTLWGGFASTVCWPLSAYLVETVGWRGAAGVYAAIQLAVVLPLYLFVLPGEERRDATVKPPETAAPIAGEVPAARRALTFAILAAVLTAGGTISALLSVHVIAILQAGGLTLAGAVAIGALIGPAQVAGRVVEMSFGGRHHPMWTLAAAVVLIAAGLVLLWLGLPLPALALISYGAGNGIWSIARGTVPLALFGPSGYAVMMGRLATPILVVQAVSPSVGAVLMDEVGASGTLGILALIALLNVAGVVALRLCSRSLPSATVAS